MTVDGTLSARFCDTTVAGFVLRSVDGTKCTSTAVAAQMLRMSDKTAFFSKSGWSQVGFPNPSEAVQFPSTLIMASFHPAPLQPCASHRDQNLDLPVSLAPKNLLSKRTTSEATLTS